MKTTLLHICVFASVIAMPGLYAEEGSFSRVTLSVVRTNSDLELTTENKTEQAHINAIQSNQNSTRIAKVGIRSQRLSNRQILEFVLSDIKGWALGYVESELFTGFVAYKKGELSIPIPAFTLSFGSETGGNETATSRSVYAAGSSTRTDTEISNYRTMHNNFILLETGLSGVEYGTFNSRTVTKGMQSTYRHSESRRISLLGGLSDVVFDGRLILKGKSYTDVSGFLPALF